MTRTHPDPICLPVLPLTVANAAAHKTPAAKNPATNAAIPHRSAAFASATIAPAVAANHKTAVGDDNASPTPSSTFFHADLVGPEDLSETSSVLGANVSRIMRYARYRSAAVPTAHNSRRTTSIRTTAENPANASVK